MNENFPRDLIYNLFQLIKQFPPSKFKQKSSDGLTQSEHELLMVLAINHNKYKKAITVTEISNLLQITPAGVTHLINSLEESGCIERLQAVKDRRIVLVGLTDKGNQAAETYIWAKKTARYLLSFYPGRLSTSRPNPELKRIPAAASFYISQYGQPVFIP